jgi:anti-sigma B factor antagonist
MALELNIIERDEDVTFLELVGSLDLDGVFEIQTRFHALAGGQGRPAIVDMSKVDYVASLGMRMLVSSARTLDKAGVKMVLLNPQPLVEEAMTQIGIENVSPIVHSEQEALKTLGVA